MKNSKPRNRLNRRQFLKASGAASAVLGSVGLGFFGYEAGNDPESYTGLETFEGAHQTFNRKRFQVEKPHYKKDGCSLSFGQSFSDSRLLLSEQISTKMK